MPLPRHVRKLGNRRALSLKPKGNKYLAFASPVTLQADITALELSHTQRGANAASTALRCAPHTSPHANGAAHGVVPLVTESLRSSTCRL